MNQQTRISLHNDDEKESSRKKLYIYVIKYEEEKTRDYVFKKIYIEREYVTTVREGNKRTVNYYMLIGLDSAPRSLYDDNDVMMMTNR